MRTDRLWSILILGIIISAGMPGATVRAQESEDPGEQGNALLDEGDYDGAIEQFTQEIQLDSSDAMAYYDRGRAYEAKHDYDMAIADYSQSLELNPDDAAARNNRGNAYAAQGHYDTAIPDYDEALRLDPNYPAAYHNRGLAHYNLGDYGMAIKDFDQALSLNSSLARTIYLRACACDLAGRTAEALDGYKHFVAVASPEDSDFVVQVKARIQDLKTQ